ncbi:hypothetical protein SS50377_26706 [Spironucleus salmonicida]|uniref:Uncharacterized protein n=1 Tax=Spironucleus salmonicida TaxID=348837 RepID=V6LY74_9EUKA|nr:hypothetical protein SS50377_26706 [Spironucleus salmonicida]|eukprot:EST49178.1 Hypothetical protein SS50377_10393 [Spironucleus salmonicida]
MDVIYPQEMLQLQSLAQQLISTLQELSPTDPLLFLYEQFVNNVQPLLSITNPQLLELTKNPAVKLDKVQLKIEEIYIITEQFNAQIKENLEYIEQFAKNTNFFEVSPTFQPWAEFCKMDLNIFKTVEIVHYDSQKMQVIDLLCKHKKYVYVHNLNLCEVNQFGELCSLCLYTRSESCEEGYTSCAKQFQLESNVEEAKLKHKTYLQKIDKLDQKYSKFKEFQFQNLVDSRLEVIQQLSRIIVIQPPLLVQKPNFRKYLKYMRDLNIFINTYAVQAETQFRKQCLDNYFHQKCQITDFDMRVVVKQLQERTGFCLQVENKKSWDCQLQIVRQLQTQMIQIQKEFSDIQSFYRNSTFDNKKLHQEMKHQNEKFEEKTENIKETVRWLSKQFDKIQ